MSRLFWAALATLVLVLPTANAGIFSKKEKPAPEVQVMELLKTLKNNPRAGERADAADELGAFDSLRFPEIVSALINALQNDSSSSVRKQAAEGLGKLRPTSVEALQALEQAEKQDDAILVRWRARTALLGYRVPPSARLPAAPAPPHAARATPHAAPVVQVIPAQPKTMAQQPTRPLPPPATEVAKPEPAGPAPLPPSAESGPILKPRTITPASLARPVPKSTPTPTEDGPILVPPMR